MAKYVDGFILVVPKGKEAEYEKRSFQGHSLAYFVDTSGGACG